MCFRFFSCWGAIALLVTCIPIARAQDVGAINGQVLDPARAAVSNATVEAVNEGTGFGRKAVSNPEGTFLIQALPPGTYRLNAQVPGFNSFGRTGIQVSVGQNTRADVELEIGALTQSVTVGATVAGVDTQGSTVGSTINNQQLASLPLLDRNMLSLASLLPGVGPASFPTTVTNSRNGPTVSVSGGRSRDNNFMLDGATMTTGLYATQQNLPSPDAVGEFRVLTNTYSVEYGQGVGSIFLAATKSGTNAFHGSAFEYFRNDVLNARNAFATTTPYLRQNQFGGNVGGPVLLPHYSGKQRTFFFVSYQGLRIRSQSLSTSYPATTLERQGDFSASTKPVRDPTTNNPFPLNRIPSSRLDPFALNVMNQFQPLLPNQPDGVTNITLRTTATGSNQITLRGDERLSSANNLFVRFYRDVDPTRETTPRTLFPLIADSSNNLVETLTASDSHTFSTSVLNELRLNYTRVMTHTIPAPGTKSARELGGNFNQSEPAPAPPDANISGRAGTTLGYYWREGDGGIYQAEDMVSWMRGRHSLKFGWASMFDRQSTQTGSQANGSFTFDGSFTGNAMADYMLGQPLTLTMWSLYDDGILQGWEHAGYVQDDIKVSRRVTLNLGVRYELHLPWINTRGWACTVRPGDQSTYIPTAPPGLLYYGDPGIPPGLYNANKHNFEP